MRRLWVRVPRRAVVPLTTEEVGEFLGSLRSWRDLSMTALMLLCGLRSREVIGLALDGIEGEGDEAVLDLDVTTNRVDAMNVYGLAREVAVLYGLPLRALDLSFRESGPPAAEALARAVTDARANAEVVAQTLGARLGAAHSVSAVGEPRGPVPLQRTAMVAMAAPSAAETYRPGELTFTATVTASFELEPPAAR